MASRPLTSHRLAIVSPEQPLTKKWPSLLMKLMNDNSSDEWLPVLERLETHPHEISIAGRNGGQTALHAACIRYPPLEVIKRMLALRPEVAIVPNFCGETPLHLASYSASEDVQALLALAAPQAAAQVDQYGDSPLHFAARQGATFPLMEILLRCCPAAIGKPNQRGVTPFWLLPRSYLAAESLEEISEAYVEEDGEESDEDDERGRYMDDWNLLVLFLRYAYFGVDSSAPQADTLCENPRYDWLIAAAASTPACPREVLRFLCRLFPEQALQYNKDGYTPLILACQRLELKEPKQWDENEDGFREYVEVVEGDIQRDHVAPEDRALSKGDAAFIQTISLATEEEEESQEPSVVEILLEWSPKSAFLKDNREAKFPLSHALLARQPWTRVIRPLIAACPKALEGRDSQGQFLFQLAAQYAPELDSVYTAVRSMPIQVQMARWSMGNTSPEPATTPPQWKKSKTER